MTITVNDVASRLESVRPDGKGGIIARCPAHADKAPSLHVSAGDERPIVAKCFAGCDTKDIERKLGFDRGAFSGADPVASVASTCRSAPTTSRGGDQERGFPTGRKTGAITATYTYPPNAAGIVNRKRRSEGKSFDWQRFEDGQWLSGAKGEIPLYRLPELIGAGNGETLVVVEGEKDADRLAGLGFVVTTTPNGASAKWREADSPAFTGRRVCVIGDDDEPGRKKMQDTAAALRKVAAHVGTLTLPNPNAIKGFDASDFLDAGGTVDDLRDLIEKALTPRLPAEIVDPAELEARVFGLWEKGGEEPGVYPGWPGLAELYRPRIGELTIVTGAPGAGKSTFVDSIAANTALGDAPSGEECPAWRWLFFSVEQFPAERHASKLLAKVLNKPFTLGPSARLSKADIRAAWDPFTRHFVFIDPTFANSSLDRILEIASQVKAIRGLEALVIDPFNIIAATSRPKSSSEHEFINEFLTKARLFAQTERVHVVVVAHPTKLKRDEGSDEYPPVRPWDISGSAHWYNHADAILSVWRPTRATERIDAGEVEVYVQKIRFQPECGEPGMVRLYYDRATGRYSEKPRPSFRTAPWESTL